MSQTTALGANPADLQAVEAIVQRAGTSFYRGMRVLPPDRRLASSAPAWRNGATRSPPCMPAWGMTR